MNANKFVINLKPYKVCSQQVYTLNELNNVLKLDWNESTIPPSPKVFNAIRNFLDKGSLEWYPNVHNERLLQLIADYSKVNLNCVQYFAGSDSLHECILNTFLKEGDLVTIISPTYDHFRVSAEIVGAKIDYYFLDNLFNFNINGFKKHISENCPKLVYICNPNNPTGTEYSLDVIKKLILNFPQTLFVVDEAYYEFGRYTSKDLVQKYSNLIITRTFSKAFGLASFRVGYAISNVENIELMNKVRNPKSVPTISQVAAIAALEDISYVNKYINQVIIARERFAKQLSNIGLKTYYGGGNFVLVELEQNNKYNLIKYLEANKIFVRDYFHIPKMENFFRITIGTVEQMDYVFEKIKRFFYA